MDKFVNNLTHAFRGRYGLPALKWNDKLGAAARAHSKDMTERNFFSHTNPDGKNAGARISGAGYEWRMYAENIAIMSAGIHAAYVVDLWVNSYGHRNNMLNDGCDELGIGVSGAYSTQCFGKQYGGW